MKLINHEIQWKTINDFPKSSDHLPILIQIGCLKQK